MTSRQSQNSVAAAARRASRAPSASSANGQETGPTRPYWGEGSADVLQWLGVSLILACCAATATLARRLPRSLSPLESGRA